MTLEEYLKTREGADNDNPLKSDCLAVREIDADQRIVEAVVSTDTVDRTREVLLPKGAKIDEYRKNPVVLWSHDSSEPPIGKCLWIRKGKNAITAAVKFATTPRAEEVWQLFRDGFLRAFSVGFRPLKGHSPEPKEIKRRPAWAEAEWIYDEWELLEFSPVTVPTNPEALIVAIKSNQLTLSEEMQKELKIFEDEIEYKCDEPEEKREAEKAKDREAEGEEKEKKVEPYTPVAPLPFVVNPKKQVAEFVEMAQFTDAVPMRATGNVKAKEFTQAAEFKEAQNFIAVIPMIDVTPIVSKREEEKKIEAAMKEEVLRRKGVVWQK